MHFVNQAFFTRRRLHKKQAARSKKCGGIYYGLAAQTPIRAHQNSGTSNLIRLKAPILSGVISATGGLTFPNYQDPFDYPANLNHYAASIKLSTLFTRSSLNSSPVNSIARIILNNFLHTATIAIFLRPFCPALTRS